MKTILIILSVLFAGSLNAQLSVDWYKSSGEISIYNPKKSVCNLADSCIYTAGMFTGQFEFDGAVISSSYLKSFFLMKTKSTGELIWLKKVAENDYWVELQSHVALTADASGDLLLGITFNRKLFFGSDSIILPDDPSTTGGLLLKLDTSGNELWHKQIFTSTVQSVATNSNEQIFVTGRTVSNDAYLSAYSTIGDSLWTKTGGSNGGYDEGNVLIIDENDQIYLGGRLEPNAGIYFDAEHPTFGNPYFSACFLAKYSQLGEIDWVRAFYTPSFSDFVSFKSICISNDKIFVGGVFDGSVLKFSPSGTNLISPNPSSSFYSTGFLLSYDTLGNLLWKKTPHKSLYGGDALFMSTQLDSGILYQTSFSGALVVGNDTLVLSNSDNGILLESFDINGNSLWHKLLNGPNGDAVMSMFNFNNSLFLNVATRSPFLQMDNTTMNFDLDTARMILMRFNSSTLGLDENETDIFSLFPNPNNGTWSFKVSQNIVGTQLKVFSVSGELVHEQILGSGNVYQIRTSLPPGVYLVQINESEKPIRLIIQ